MMEKTDTLLLDYTPIDDNHQQFVELLKQLETTDNAQFPQLFRQLYEHTEAHFDLENRLMDQYAFPAAAEHKGEHQRVLAEFRQFSKRVDKGLITFGRSYVKERLPQWFELHVTTMDSALVAHVKKAVT